MPQLVHPFFEGERVSMCVKSKKGSRSRPSKTVDACRTEYFRKQNFLRFNVHSLDGVTEAYFAVEVIKNVKAVCKWRQRKAERKFLQLKALLVFFPRI